MHDSPVVAKVKRMLDLEKVNQLAMQAATTSFGKANVSRVSSESTADSTGRDALRILIVFPGKSIPKEVNGDALLNNLVKLDNLLQQNGDYRLPILQYATEDELEHSGDTES